MRRKSQPYLPSRRKCHDCGKSTSDYRCEACWAKLRASLGISQEAARDCLEVTAIFTGRPRR